VRWQATGVALLALALLTGCGSSSAAQYSRPAFQSCLNQNNVVTHTLGQVPQSVRRLFTQIGSLNFIAGTFPDSNEVGFFFARNRAGVAKIVTSINNLQKRGLTTPGRLVTHGNMVLLMGVHGTAGEQKIINTCEASARVTS
jgi:hypothetical protein